jgi:hypothetical protein
MTMHNVHTYRELKLRFDRIEAESPEAAAAIARDKPTDEADDIDDCDSETFSALVDVVGDEEYEQSRVIDFEPERLRNAAPKMLSALKYALEFLEANDDGEEDVTSRVAAVRAAIDEAKAAGIPSEPTNVDFHAVLARRRQIAAIWCIDDVKAVRPDLTEAQCWEVLEATKRYHDATFGINWVILSSHADDLFGDAPDLDEPEED